MLAGADMVWEVGLQMSRTAGSLKATHGSLSDADIPCVTLPHIRVSVSGSFALEPAN
jgi:hypothetical protein